jgi:hypothetical protein
MKATAMGKKTSKDKSTMSSQEILLKDVLL